MPATRNAAVADVLVGAEMVVVTAVAEARVAIVGAEVVAALAAVVVVVALAAAVAAAATEAAEWEEEDSSWQSQAAKPSG